MTMIVMSEMLCPKCGTVLTEKERGVCVNCLLTLGEIPLDHIESSTVKNDLMEVVRLFPRDIAAAFNKDPAAVNIMEVLSSYPGIQAIILHRVAHLLHELGVPFIPRFISHISRLHTQIEIHPGAKIGTDFFIDHGCGVVIGETAEIGNNVTIYQGVTLGGTSMTREKRHPTIGNDVVIGAGAKILGPVKIGDRVRVGANAVITRDVPSDSVVVGVPGRIVARDGQRIPKIDLEHGDLPDPIREMISSLSDRINDLEAQVTGGRGGKP